MKDTYPGPRTLSETQRLQCQHKLATHCFGGLIPFSRENTQYAQTGLDLSAPGLKILDSATADGYWLFDLRSYLTHPESAELIGADIAEYPAEERSYQAPSNISFVKQDMREDWPIKYHGKFDLVHQRAALASTGSFDGGVEAVKRLLGNLKVGGWVLLVDGEMTSGAFEPSDKPSQKMWKTVGNFLSIVGLYPSLGSQAKAILEEASDKAGIKLAEVTSKQAAFVIGKGAGDGLEDIGYAWLRGMQSSMGAALDAMGKGKAPMSGVEFEQLVLEVMEEAKQDGVHLPWFAAWGRRTA